MVFCSSRRRRSIIQPNLEARLSSLVWRHNNEALMVESMNTLAKISCADVDMRSRILTFRGVQVMLDRDLAELYGVDVKRLNQQVNRNLDRFPERFMHQLTMQEFADLKLQIATSSWGGVRKPPKVFTEQGISMLSAVLHTQTAVQVSIRNMDESGRGMRRFLH